jgi:hypothetical protein
MVVDATPAAFGASATAGQVAQISRGSSLITGSMSFWRWCQLFHADKQNGEDLIAKF